MRAAPAARRALAPSAARASLVARAIAARPLSSSQHTPVPKIPTALRRLPHKLPRHQSDSAINNLLEHAEVLIKKSSDHAGTVRSRGGRRKALSNNMWGDGRVESLGMLGKIFSNQYVDMSEVDTVGFDHDYTLVSYTPLMNQRIYELACERLIEDHCYPEELRSTTCGHYDHESVIRGLAIDKRTATMVKITYSSHVVAGRLGHRWLSKDEITEVFGFQGALPNEARDQRLLPMNDLYSLAGGCLLADVVQYFEERGVPYQPPAVVADVMQAIAAVHITGDIHREVLQSLPSTTMLAPAPNLRAVLQSVRDAGKNTFILTNSHLWYLEPQLKLFIGEDWRDFFDLILCAANKPAWYSEHTPFREVMPDGSWSHTKLETLERGKVYAQGSIFELTRLTGYDGRKVIYFGDAIFTDLVEARRGEFNWNTACVMHELNAELAIAHSRAYREKVFAAHVLSTTIRLAQEAMGQDRGPHDRELVDALYKEWNLMYKESQQMFNMNWGSVFRSWRDPSIFAFALRRHCDLYMPHLENLRNYSPETRFYPHNSMMLTHEVLPNVDPAVELLGEMASEQRRLAEELKASLESGPDLPDDEPARDNNDPKARSW